MLHPQGLSGGNGDDLSLYRKYFYIYRKFEKHHIIYVHHILETCFVNIILLFMYFYNLKPTISIP